MSRANGHGAARRDDVAEARRITQQCLALLAGPYTPSESDAAAQRLSQYMPRLPADEQERLLEIYRRLVDLGPLDVVAERRAIQEADRREPAPVTADWPTLRGEALYGLAGDIVRRIEPHTESDPAALLLQTLTAFGAAAGRHSYYQVEDDRHYPHLYICAVGVSGRARKGTSWGRVLAMFAGAEPTWAERCIAGGLSSGEGVIASVRDDGGDDDKRRLIVETELSQALAVIRREGNTLSAILRNAWDRGSIRTLTKTPLRATGAHISIIGHITTHELLRHLTDTEATNGFANRFLWACVRRSKSLPFGGGAVDVSGIHHQLRQALDLARRDSAIPMSAGARALWPAMYERLTAPRAGLLGAVTSRAEAQTCRLALIYALLDGSREIRPEHLTAAAAVWDYCDASAQYIFGQRLGDPIADRILTELQSHPAGLSRTDLRNLFARHKSAEIDHALQALLAAGVARPIAQPTAGRSAEIWRVSI